MMIHNTEKRLSLILFIALFTPNAASGQQVAHSDMSAVIALSDFEQAYAAKPYSTLKADALTYMVFRADSFPDARIDSILEGMEDLALNSASQRVRQEAALVLAMAGDDYEGARVAIPGSINRVDRVFHASTDELVRVTLVGRMATQAEKQAAIKFLVKAAQEAIPEEQNSAEPPALWAIQALLQIDTSESRAALRDLNSSGSVATSAARGRLRDLASRGFRPDR